MIIHLSYLFFNFQNSEAIFSHIVMSLRSNNLYKYFHQFAEALFVDYLMVNSHKQPMNTLK